MHRTTVTVPQCGHSICVLSGGAEEICVTVSRLEARGPRLPFMSPAEVTSVIVAKVREIHAVRTIDPITVAYRSAIGV
jgi:hypothetical protein